MMVYGNALVIYKILKVTPVKTRKLLTLTFFSISMLFILTIATGATTTSTTNTLDKFGITKLYENDSGGREWISKWDNGHARTWTDQANDPDDPQFWTKWKGTGAWKTDGNGILSISGSAPRMYVIDQNQNGKWRNVEITLYGKRVSDRSTPWGGLEAVTRTNHMADSNLCDTRGIAARIRYDGHYDFEKETSHPNSVAVNNKVMWPDGMIYNTWIGYKFVVYDLANGSVKLELWYDDTDGVNGGNWKKINEFVDTGRNFGAGGTPCGAGINPAMQLNLTEPRPGSETGKPNLAVYFRSDNVNTNGLLYKKASIREIVPIRIDSANGIISGTVKSSSGTPISGAVVSDGTHSATTNATGTYTLSNAPCGTYTLKTSATGYQSSNKSATVYCSQTTVLNFTLTSSAQKAVQFDGNGDYAEVPDHNDFSITTTKSLTVSFWLKPNALDFTTTEGSAPAGAYINFLGKGEYDSQNQIEWYFRMYNKTNANRPNRISFYIFNLSGGKGTGSYFQDNVTVGKWIHIAGKIDNKYIYIYKNGVLRDKDDYTAGSIHPQNGKAPLRIGTVTKSSYIKGAMDDITIYNRSLTDTEIANIYNGNKPRNRIVAEWTADEGSGSYLIDSSGRNHNGKLYGNTAWITGHGS